MPMALPVAVAAEACDFEGGCFDAENVKHCTWMQE